MYGDKRVVHRMPLVDFFRCISVSVIMDLGLLKTSVFGDVLCSPVFLDLNAMFKIRSLLYKDLILNSLSAVLTPVRMLFPY